MTLYRERKVSLPECVGSFVIVRWVVTRLSACMHACAHINYYFSKQETRVSIDIPLAVWWNHPVNEFTKFIKHVDSFLYLHVQVPRISYLLAKTFKNLQSPSSSLSCRSSLTFDVFIHYPFINISFKTNLFSFFFFFFWKWYVTYVTKTLD